MKKLFMTFILVILLSLPLLATLPVVDASTLPTITWEEAGSDYLIIHIDETGKYTVIVLDGKYFVIET